MPRWPGFTLAKPVPLLCGLLFFPGHNVGLEFGTCSRGCSRKNEIIRVQGVFRIRVESAWVNLESACKGITLQQELTRNNAMAIRYVFYLGDSC